MGILNLGNIYKVDVKESETEAFNIHQNSEKQDGKTTQEIIILGNKKYLIMQRPLIQIIKHEWMLSPQNPLIISPNKPIITRTTYNKFSTHIICAFNAMICFVKETTDKTLYEKIKNLLRMRNKMVLNSSITKKLSVIFQTDYSDMIMRIIMETTGEKNYKTSEESRFLFFIRHTLVDFVAMFKYLSPRVLVRDMSERLYIVECLSPILCAFRNAFPDVKYE
ncbi:11543_t:CDS:2 [Entrophospora sp. SA101]|nr:11543_t:CDS:2 [Entrophospora sp. SA101]